MHTLQEFPPAARGIPDAVLIGAAVPDDHCPDATFAHGPFLVEPDGVLRATGAPALHFAWRGRDCEARITADEVRLSADVGAVPYTAERRADRPGALAAIGTMPGELPQGWRLRVKPDHRLRLEMVWPMPGPTTATALVGAMVGFALALDPYLARLESAGIAGGRVKT